VLAGEGVFRSSDIDNLGVVISGESGAGGGGSGGVEIKAFWDESQKVGGRI